MFSSRDCRCDRRDEASAHLLTRQCALSRIRPLQDLEPAARPSPIAPVGLVFDLRQQGDFIRARAANHGAGLVRLGDGEEEP
jgi:hypothetical protein